MVVGVSRGMGSFGGCSAWGEKWIPWGKSLHGGTGGSVMLSCKKY